MMTDLVQSGKEDLKEMIGYGRLYCGILSELRTEIEVADGINDQLVLDPEKIEEDDHDLDQHAHVLPILYPPSQVVGIKKAPSRIQSLNHGLFPESEGLVIPNIRRVQDHVLVLKLVIKEYHHQDPTRRDKFEFYRFNKT
jgi:hypothetical protein